MSSADVDHYERKIAEARARFRDDVHGLGGRLRPTALAERAIDDVRSRAIFAAVPTMENLSGRLESARRFVATAKRPGSRGYAALGLGLVAGAALAKALRPTAVEREIAAAGHRLLDASVRKSLVYDIVRDALHSKAASTVAAGALAAMTAAVGARKPPSAEAAPDAPIDSTRRK